MLYTDVCKLYMDLYDIYIRRTRGFRGLICPAGF